MESLEALAGPAALAIFASGLALFQLKRHYADDDKKDIVLVGLTKAVGEFPAALALLTTTVRESALRERARRAEDAGREAGSE